MSDDGYHCKTKYTTTTSHPSINFPPQNLIWCTTHAVVNPPPIKSHILQQPPHLEPCFMQQGGVCHTLALSFIYIKKCVWRQKKNYENANISACKKYNLQKNPQKETKILQDIIINSITNLKFQLKPKYIIFQKSSYRRRSCLYLFVAEISYKLSFSFTKWNLKNKIITQHTRVLKLKMYHGNNFLIKPMVHSSSHLLALIDNFLPLGGLFIISDTFFKSPPSHLSLW